MGHGPSATLFFGYIWGEEYPEVLSGDSEDEWSNGIALRRGFLDPWTLIPEIPYEEFTDEHHKWLDDFREIKKNIEEEMGVDVAWYGSTDGSGVCMPYVYVKELIVNPYNWEYAKVDPELLNLNGIQLQLAEEKLHNFMVEVDFDVEDAEGPAWFMAPDYG